MKAYHQSIRVVGLPFYDFSEIQSKLKAGIPLVLHREPSNAKDKNAIEVLVFGDALGDPALAGQPFKLGYLKANIAEDLAPIMDAADSTLENQSFGCMITGFINPTADAPSHMLAIIHGPRLKGVRGCRFGEIPDLFEPNVPRSPKSSRSTRINVWI